MRKKPAGNNPSAETIRRIRTKEAQKDIRILDRADNLSGYVREDYVRTKEHMVQLQDDGGQDSTQYAIDRAKETSEATAYEAGQKTKYGQEKARQQLKKQFRKQQEKKTVEQTSKETAKELHKETGPVHQSTNHGVDRAKAHEDVLKQTEHSETIRIKRPSVKTTSLPAGNQTEDLAGRSVNQSTIYIPVKTTTQDKTIKTTAKSYGRATIKTAQHSVKRMSHDVKTAERSTRITIKTAQQTSRAAVKTSKAAAKTAQQATMKAQKAAIAAQKAAEATVRAVIVITKAVAAAVKGLITAGSTVLIASLPAIILGAVIFGIAVLFTGDTKREDAVSNTADVVQKINEDYQLQMDIIKNRFSFDEISITGARPTWEEVLSIYTAKSAGEPEKTWDEYTGLSLILWDMTTMSYTIEAQIPGETAVMLPQKELIRAVDVTFEFLTDGGYLRKTETVTYQRGDTANASAEEGLAGLLPEEWAGKEVTTILTITMGSRSVEEMEEKYGFSDNQKAQTQMLLSEDLAEFWLARIYGLMGSDEEIVKVALTQLGNTGGYPYWAYCGFPSRVEWCACFVSWCAGQCGYIEKGLIPNTGSPEVQVAWFKSQGKWQDGSITPTPGMIIFYDWYGKNFPDHVGIVEYVENGVIHTVEGNSSDSVRQRQYPVGDSRILGFGIILEK